MQGFSPQLPARAARGVRSFQKTRKQLMSLIFSAEKIKDISEREGAYCHLLSV